MEIYAPRYYEKFRCIADKCLHSCCVGWEIDIDEKTYEKYQNLPQYSKNEILKTIEKRDGCFCFGLDRDGRCKNLDERGLCKIITNHGESYLADICRLHPRFLNRVGNKIEMGIGLSCEEAVRIVLSDKERFELVRVGENCEKNDTASREYDPISERDKVIDFIENEKGAFIEKLEKLEEGYGVSVEYNTYDEWIDYLLSFEILDEDWKENLKNAKEKEPKSDLSQYGSELEALFKYFVFRHVSTAENEASFLARVGFASLGVRLVKYLAEREEALTESRLYELVRLYSSEIEYSEENTDELILEIEMSLI